MTDYTDEQLAGNVSMEVYEQVCKHYGKKPVAPIGQCFDNTGLAVLGSPEMMNKMTVCHAIGTATMPGQEGNEMKHAWIEFIKEGELLAADTTWGFVCEAKQYREQLNVTYVVEYTAKEYLALWKEHDHPGPYDEKIEKAGSK